MHVVTTPAPEQDVDVVDAIHTALAEQRITPAEHYLDSGYVIPETIHRASTAHAITVVGPVRQDPRAVERPGLAKEDWVGTARWPSRLSTENGDCRRPGPRGNTRCLDVACATREAQ